MDTSKNLLVEIGTEEIPAGFLPAALEALKSNTEEIFREQRLEFDVIKTMATPRRLVLWVGGLRARQSDLVEKVMGPPKGVAFDEDGRPTKAAEGFAKRNNCSMDDLEVEETDKGPYVCINKVVKGRPTVEVLEEVLPTLVSGIPFPKNMKWEASGFRFARPIRWLCGVFGEEPLAFEVAGLVSGTKSYGHRFHHPEVVEVSPDLQEYIARMEAAFVIVDQDKRRRIILDQAVGLSSSAGGELLSDDALLEQNTFLVEYPHCILGSFESDFLALPKEVLITVMREHQKYFAVVDSEGNLMAYFIAVNNIRPRDDRPLTKGHERVLRARLNDARFFFEEDLKRPLEDYVQDLKGVIFHKDLGSLYDKVIRVKRLAEYLAQILAQDTYDVVSRAAYLAKADLVTEMVGEFPDLQGVMGRVYAGRSGEPEAVATAIYEHYLPVRSGGDLPETIPGALLSIADRCDTICSTFALGMRPTGGQDPFGLRRHALAILHIVEQKGFDLDLNDLIEKCLQILDSDIDFGIDIGALGTEILEFFRVRLKNELISRGLSHDSVEAALGAHFDQPVDAILRAKAIEAVRHRPEFEPLSIAFKRCMNILKGQSPPDLDPNLLKEDAEKALFEALEAASKDVAPLFESRAYEEAMLVLLKLKPAVDRFFDEVLVMTEDDALRGNRLALVARITGLFLKIGNFSAISSGL